MSVFVGITETVPTYGAASFQTVNSDFYRMRIETKIGNIDPQTRLHAISYFSTGPSGNHLWLDHLSTGQIPSL